MSRTIDGAIFTTSTADRCSGISTPADHPLIFIFTGTEGEEHGYEDRLLENGVFQYAGEGQVGDMRMIRGNRALRDHRQDGKTVHLFTTDGQESGFVEYMGEVSYLDDRRQIGPDRNGDMREVILFDFALDTSAGGTAARSVQQDDRERDGLSGKSLAELRRIAIESGAGRTTRPSSGSSGSIAAARP